MVDLTNKENFLMETMPRYIKNIDHRQSKYVNINGKNLLNLSSNDYLGLSTDEQLIKEFFENFGKKYFLSSASARLLSGTEKIYNDLETLLAKMFGKEKALIFNTGYQCNLGVISTLNTKGNVVFSDKLNHASIIDGLRLADGDFYRFKHLDYEHLEELLKKHRDKYNNAIIVSESVFSMDGDLANIAKLVELKKKYNCQLMIDDAHAFMCLDDDFGGGTSKNFDVDIVTATFGKALGSFGAFVTANSEIITTLINKSRPFIFSTAIPPINIAWTYWLLTEKVDFILEKKKQFIQNIVPIISKMKSLDITTTSFSHIIPIIFKDAEKTEKICEELQGMGYYVLPIRPPTVPENTCRIRISLTAEITLEDIEPLLEKIADELKLVK